jgi:hypothetical protein
VAIAPYPQTPESQTLAETPAPVPAYKHWWFWMIVVLALAVAGLVLAYLTEHDIHLREHNATNSTTPASPAPSPSPTVGAQAAVNNSNAQPATLGQGVFVVGKDLPEGRYVITPADGQTGGLVVSNQSDPVIVNEVLGGPNGVPSVTSDLRPGDQVKVTGLSSISLAPSTAAPATTLTAGNWTVGVDLKAGNYVIAPVQAGEIGTLKVTRGSDPPVVSETLGGTQGVSNVSVELQDGDVVSLSGLPAGVSLSTSG